MVGFDLISKIIGLGAGVGGVALTFGFGSVLFLSGRWSVFDTVPESITQPAPFWFFAGLGMLLYSVMRYFHSPENVVTRWRIARSRSLEALLTARAEEIFQHQTRRVIVCKLTTNEWRELWGMYLSEEHTKFFDTHQCDTHDSDALDSLTGKELILHAMPGNEYTSHQYFRPVAWLIEQMDRLQQPGKSNFEELRATWKYHKL